MIDEVWVLTCMNDKRLTRDDLVWLHPSIVYCIMIYFTYLCEIHSMRLYILWNLKASLNYKRDYKRL